MTMEEQPRPRLMAYDLAPALLVLGMVLAVGRWYLQPERALATMSVVVLLLCMTAVLFVARRTEQDASRRRTSDALQSGIVFGGLIVAISLGASLAATLGAIDDADRSRRTTMAILGAYFMFTGNALPKTLTPLSVLRCDGARMQAFQRFAGWTWVLTGLAFATAWLALPIALAQPVSILLLLSSMLLIASRIVSLRRTAS